MFQILTILHPTVLLPPMGLFHKPVNTKLRKPIVSYVLKKKNKKMSKLYYFCMRYEYELKNQVGDVKPEEAATCKQIRKTLHGLELPLPVTPKTLKYLHTCNGCY